MEDFSFGFRARCALSVVAAGVAWYLSTVVQPSFAEQLGHEDFIPHLRFVLAENWVWLALPEAGAIGFYFFADWLGDFDWTLRRLMLACTAVTALVLLSTATLDRKPPRSAANGWYLSPSR